MPYRSSLRTWDAQKRLHHEERPCHQPVTRDVLTFIVPCYRENCNTRVTELHHSNFKNQLLYPSCASSLVKQACTLLLALWCSAWMYIWAPMSGTCMLMPSHTLLTALDKHRLLLRVVSRRLEEAKVIDLEVSGQEGTARYGYFLNDVIKWPLQAPDGQLITQQHDRTLLETVITSYASRGLQALEPPEASPPPAAAAAAA